MSEPLVSSEFVRALDGLIKEHFPAGTTLKLGDVNLLVLEDEYCLDSSAFRLRIPRDVSDASSPNVPGEAGR